MLSDKLLLTLAEEIALEFPSIDKMPDTLIARNYENIKDDFWSE